MGLERVWKDDASRAVEVLGGEPTKYVRDVEDKLVLNFTLEEWRKLFNIVDEYAPCGADWIPYKANQPLNLHFIRRVKDERR